MEPEVLAYEEMADVPAEAALDVVVDPPDDETFAVELALEVELALAVELTAVVVPNNKRY